ncbi:MAG: hypothetical protein ACKOWH_00625 [Rhodoluna sp.]
MRPVQIIQSASALLAAIVITFLQPQREQIGVLIIGTYGLLIVAFGFAASHVVTAILQKRRRAYIANGVALIFFTYIISACFNQLPMMQAHLFEDRPAGADNTFDLMAFGLLATFFLFAYGFATLGIALSHRKMGNIFRDNLITAIIMIGFAVAEFMIPGNGVKWVGFFNAACILLAVHLGIAAFSPKQNA